MTKQFIRITNWGEFQHYKDRSPPWIKLHKCLLASETWVSLDDASRVLAVACMLLAADTDNKTPLNLTYIKRVAYLNQEPDFAPLVACGFVEIIEENGNPLASASTLLAVDTVCSPEKRREEEMPLAGRKRAPPKTPLPKGFGITDSLREWASKKGHTRLEERMEHFIAAAKAKGYTYADWEQAFQNAVRDDWAKLNGKGGAGVSRMPTTADGMVIHIARGPGQ